MRAVHAFVYEPVPLGEALHALCCWWSSVGPGCLALVSLCLLHHWLLLPYTWIMQIGFAWLFLLQGPPTRPSPPLAGFSLHEGCSCYLVMGSCSLGSFFREHVPFSYLALFSCLLSGVCTALLVSSLYCKLVMLFLIYKILTFDKKKKKNGFSSFRARLIRTNKFWPYHCNDLHGIVLQVHNKWKVHHICFM
jgi:hypothetical protein